MATRFAVLKLSEATVSSRAGWQTIATQIARHHHHERVPILVCSALPGVTGALQRLLQHAAGAGDTERPLAQLRERHLALAGALGLDPGYVRAELEALDRLILGTSLLGEIAPGVSARALATAPTLVARLGAAWLEAQQLDACFVDARQLLRADAPGAPREPRVSGIACGPDPELIARLGVQRCVITPGAIASDPEGKVMALHPGGVDASATLLAARLSADVCEIWADVPGMFTADPQICAEARLLKALDYAEAQEIATTRAEVIHPGALAPLRIGGIPLQICSTSQPGLEGTRVGPDEAEQPAQVKALSSRRGLVLISMETVGMWQQVGFLAEVFSAFARHGLSIDTVSTSETNVTVTLDPGAHAHDDEVLDALLIELEPICSARLLTDCASVSLVGRGIRSILHRLAPALELFEEHRVHLVSQAASDLNLTFVVDEDTADRLLLKLHGLLFAHRGSDRVLGPSWRALSSPRGTPDPLPPWWRQRSAELLAIAAEGTPAYAYDAATITQRAQQLLQLRSVDRVLYAMKANAHPEVLRCLRALGLGFECVSPAEIARARATPGPEAPILFTPNFAAPAEYTDALQAGVHVTLDNLHPLQAWPQLFAGRRVFVRLDPDRGRGHHAKVRTAGSRSKFGISSDQLDALEQAVHAAGCEVVGLHAHAGSGVLDATAWQDTALFLASVAERFPRVEILDLGGGLGIPDRAGRAPLDLLALDEALASFREAHPRFSLWIEPGRFLVAEAGVLLARVTQLKRKGPLRYVGVDAGMHTLMRPALYGAYHPVFDLSRLDAPLTQTATVVGPICETGDVLARDRRLPEVEEGDVLLIANAGAYGASMANRYNLRGLPREAWLTPDPAG